MLQVLECPFAQPSLKASAPAIRSLTSQLLFIERNHPFV